MHHGGICINYRFLSIEPNKEYADFVFVALFSSTPLWIVILIMLGAVVYVTYSGGLRSISRCSEIIGPISVVGIILIILLSMKDWGGLIYQLDLFILCIRL